jgi:DNA-binding transcriptional ArsR family regulator
MSLAAVVQHIQVLEDGGLVRTRKVGRVRTCALEFRGFDLASRWINARKSLWEQRLDSLGALLDEEG